MEGYTGQEGYKYCGGGCRLLVFNWLFWSASCGIEARDVKAFIKARVPPVFRGRSSHENILLLHLI